MTPTYGRRNNRSRTIVVATGAVAALALTAIPAAGEAAPASPNARTDFVKLNAVSASSPTDAWAVGFTQPSGEHTQGLTRHWDGTRWKTIPSAQPMDYNFTWGVAAISPTDAWAVGEGIGQAMILPFIEHWDGTRWTVKHFPDGPGIGKLTAVAADGSDNVWMVGTRNDDVFQYPRPLLAHWNGTRIQRVRIPHLDKARNVELSGVSVNGPDDVWVVGTHGRRGATNLPFMEHFDGTSWHIVSGDPAQGSIADLSGVDAASSTDAWSVGWYVPEGQSEIAAYAQHWDGTTWTQSPVPTPGYASLLTSVSVVAPDDVWAVGSWRSAIQQATDHPFVIHWDGTSWSTVRAPRGAGHATELQSVDMTASDNGFAVGDQVVAGGQARPYSIRWNGSAWTR